MSATTDVEQLRNEWLERLNALIDIVEGWGKELDWVTRRIETTLKDSQLGKYKAPALVMQKETYRVLLEPITHAAPGADGVADLYVMPGWDDIARLYHSEGSWKIGYMFPDAPRINGVRESISKPLSREVFIEALDAMKQHAE